MTEFTKNLTELTKDFMKKSFEQCEDILFKGDYAITKNNRCYGYTIQKIYAICLLNTGDISFIWMNKSELITPELNLGLIRPAKKWKVKAEEDTSIYLNDDDINKHDSIQVLIQKLVDKFNIKNMKRNNPRFIIATKYLIDTDMTIFQCIDRDDNQL